VPARSSSSWPDQYLVSDVETTEIKEGAALIDEGIAPDTDFVAAGGVKWRDLYEAFVHLSAEKFAEQSPNFGVIVEPQSVAHGGDSHRSFDICHHGG
jgi:hypothetical protein